jgi:hypothetical protein
VCVYFPLEVLKFSTDYLNGKKKGVEFIDNWVAGEGRLNWIEVNCRSSLRVGMQIDL